MKYSLTFFSNFFQVANPAFMLLYLIFQIAMFVIQLQTLFINVLWALQFPLLFFKLYTFFSKMKMTLKHLLNFSSLTVLPRLILRKMKSHQIHHPRVPKLHHFKEPHKNGLYWSSFGEGSGKSVRRKLSCNCKSVGSIAIFSDNSSGRSSSSLLLDVWLISYGTECRINNIIVTGVMTIIPMYPWVFSERCWTGWRIDICSIQCHWIIPPWILDQAEWRGLWWSGLYVLLLAKFIVLWIFIWVYFRPARCTSFIYFFANADWTKIEHVLAVLTLLFAFQSIEKEVVHSAATMDNLVLRTKNSSCLFCIIHAFFSLFTWVLRI